VSTSKSFFPSGAYSSITTAGFGCVTTARKYWLASSKIEYVCVCPPERSPGIASPSFRRLVCADSPVASAETTTTSTALVRDGNALPSGRIA
jgi:hypothetical protein